MDAIKIIHIFFCYCCFLHHNGKPKQIVIVICLQQCTKQFDHLNWHYAIWLFSISISLRVFFSLSLFLTDTHTHTSYTFFENQANCKLFFLLFFIKCLLLCAKHIVAAATLREFSVKTMQQLNVQFDNIIISIAIACSYTIHVKCTTNFNINYLLFNIGFRSINRNSFRINPVPTGKEENHFTAQRNKT